MQTNEDAPTRAETDERLSLWERIQKIREEVTYIIKTDLPSSAPYKSAVAHHILLEKVRPHLVKAGIAWSPYSVEVLHQREHPTKAGSMRIWSQIKTIVRFYCTDCPGEYHDIPVLSEGLDDQDKGSAKAATYAEKQALLWLLNLTRGDDPDFDRLGAEADIAEEVTERCNKIQELYQRHPDYTADAGAGWRGWLVRYARSHGRYRTPTMYGLPDEVLDKWIVELEDEIVALSKRTEAKDGRSKTSRTVPK